MRCLCHQKQFLPLLVLSSTQRKSGLTSSISKIPGRSPCLLFQLLLTIFPLEQAPWLGYFPRLVVESLPPTKPSFLPSLPSFRGHHSQQLRLLRTLVLLFLLDSCILGADRRRQFPQSPRNLSSNLPSTRSRDHGQN